MPIKYGLLALLTEGPAYGYQLKADFEARTGGSWDLNIGQVYTTLQRLERDGLVEPIGGEGERNDYRITSAGRIQLDEWYATPVVAEGPPRDELMIKVLLAVAAADVDVTDILQRQRRASVEQLQAYTRRKARAHPIEDLAFLLMLDALIFRTEAEIERAGAQPIRSVYYNDASFVKFRELSLHYSLPGQLARKLGAQRASVTVATRNLYTWTKWTQLDPESSSLPLPGGGFDQSQMPQMAQATVLLRLTF